MNKLRSIILAFTALTATVASAENMFATVLGKTEDETKEKIEKIWSHFFTPGDITKYEADGQRSIYYLTDNDKAYIMDTGNNDVRTEGMSYGMMISVQLDIATNLTSCGSGARITWLTATIRPGADIFVGNAPPTALKSAQAMPPTANYIMSPHCFSPANGGMSRVT